MTALPQHGLVLGKFYPPHAGHHHLIDVAAAGCQQLTVLVAAATVESVPGWQRARWIQAEHPDARVIWCVDDVPCDYDDLDVWDQHMEIFEKAIGRPVDAVFSSEAYGDELARRLGAQHVLVDPARDGYPVSGTAVRDDPAAHWDLLTAKTRAALTKRVVVLGAESTGTTTLSRQLADHYRTSWVGEYGREVSYEKQAAGTLDTWTQGDFLRIYLGQSRREEDAPGGSGDDRRHRPVCDVDLGGALPRSGIRGGVSSGRVASAAGAVHPHRSCRGGLRAGRHPRRGASARLDDRPLRAGTERAACPVGQGHRQPPAAVRAGRRGDQRDPRRWLAVR